MSLTQAYTLWLCGAAVGWVVAWYLALWSVGGWRTVKQMRDDALRKAGRGL